MEVEMRAVMAVLLVACGGEKDSATPLGGTAGGTLSGTTPSGTSTFPADPRPVEIEFSGVLNETMTFDSPECSNYPDPSLVNFRMFWRGPHNAVLIAEVLTDFTGAGSYDTDTHNLRVKLQTEAGSTYSFEALAVDTSQGDSATLQIDQIDDVAHGSFDFTGMHSTAGAVTATPSTVPVWCETVTN